MEYKMMEMMMTKRVIWMEPSFVIFSNKPFINLGIQRKRLCLMSFLGYGKTPFILLPNKVTDSFVRLEHPTARSSIA